MDKKRLAKFGKQSPESKALFDYFRSRQRNPKDGIMDLRRARYEVRDRGMDIEDKEFVEHFKELERLGVGRLIDKGPIPRFKWTVNMKKAVEPVDEEERTSAPAPVRRDTPRMQQDYTTVVVLPGDRSARLSVPQDISPEEIDSLCRALKRALIAGN